MFGLLWKWLISLFTADKIGVLVRAFLLKAGTTIALEILDPENQKKAYELVKELNADNTKTNWEKAELFNIKMASWAKKVGKKILTSQLNCLRELAVNALKAEMISKDEQQTT